MMATTLRGRLTTLGIPLALTAVLLLGGAPAAMVANETVPREPGRRYSVARGLPTSARETVAVDATSTPYHEGRPSPVATPHAMRTPAYPLPAPQDPASADVMAAGGAAMVRAADGMAEAAVAMVASSDPTLAELGRHWEQDARALRERGAWMILSATSESMVHDPSRAHELDLLSLKGNGMAMVAEGQAMADHGREMATQAEQLRQNGAITPDLADDLVASADALIATGEALVSDGEAMQAYADRLLESIGR